MERNAPGAYWESKTPVELGMSGDELSRVERWLHDSASGEPYRALVIRHGCIAAEWNHGMSADEKIPQASAGKSLYSCLLGIAVSEGRIPGLDARVFDYYPEMMDVGEGEGPKAGRYSFEKDRDITFRQLIGNTSGYMKPGEEPGKHFHYQTFGMNVITNSLATIYGLYDSSEPDSLPGCGILIQQKIRDVIGGTWEYTYGDFEHPPGARKNIFGHSLSILSTARDAARMAQLWLNGGNWNGVQVVPSDYLREATATNSNIIANEPERRWRYGMGFWVNDYGKQWPKLPRDSFAAWGGGARHIWASPELDLIVVLNPAPWAKLRNEKDRLEREEDALYRIVNAVND